jgi:hypothetical protein
MAKPEHKYAPLSKFNEDEKVLKGFIWKPKDRPVSKESVIHSSNYTAQAKTDNKGKASTKTSGKTSAKGAPAKTTTPVKAGKDTSTVKKDTSAVKPANIVPAPGKTSKDSVQKQAPDTGKKGKDTSAVKKPVVKS